MSSSSTPGPWRARKSVEPGESAEWEVVFDAADMQLVVAMTFGGTGPEGHEENAEANARLIAAAPELLRACEQAVEWLEGWASAEPYIGVLRAAIAKATGNAACAPEEHPLKDSGWFGMPPAETSTGGTR